MNTKIFISSDSGIESIPGIAEIGVLPDNYVFSNIEQYTSAEMDAESFILRIQSDKIAHPIVTNCNKEVLDEVLEDANALEYDCFLFILSEKKMALYRPLIEEYESSHPEISMKYYVTSSVLFPVVYMAIEANYLIKQGADFSEVVESLEFYDKNNAVYLYSPQEDVLPKVEKFAYDEDVLKITGSSYFYVIRQNNPLSIHLKERNKSILPQLDGFVNEIKGKDIIPFVLYSNSYSRYNAVFGHILERIFPKMNKLRMYEITPEIAVEYGKYCVGLGYVAKKNIKKPE